MTEPRVLTDAEVEELDRSYYLPDIHALIAWGRSWQTRATTAEAALADTTQERDESRRQLEAEMCLVEIGRRLEASYKAQRDALREQVGLLRSLAKVAETYRRLEKQGLTEAFAYVGKQLDAALERAAAGEVAT